MTTAVDVHGISGNPTRFVRREEGDQGSELFGLPDPPYRMRCLASLEKRRVFLFIEPRLAV